MKRIKVVLILFFLVGSITAQERFVDIRRTLETVSKDVIGLTEKVAFSVSNISVAEFLRGIGNAHNLNISVNSNVGGTVINNFSDAKVIDVFVHLCMEYDLNIKVVGTIMAFEKYIAPIAPKTTFSQKLPEVKYNDQTDFLSLNLKSDSIEYVVMEITKQSVNTVIIGPDVPRAKQISVFIQNRPFESALEKMAYSNGLILEKTDDRYFILKNDNTSKEIAKNNSKSNSRSNRNSSALIDM